MGDYLVYSLYRLTGTLTRHVPPRVAYRAAGLLGLLLYILSPRLRHALIDNMRHVLGPQASTAQIRRCVRGICANIIRSNYDLLRVDLLTISEIKKRVTIEGWEHLEQAMAQGHGVIIVAPHFGNVDVVMQIPVVYGLPVTIVAEHIRPERIFRYALKLRASHGLRILPSDGSMLPLFRALKRGEAIGLACDRAISDNVRATPLFGAPAWLPDGPVQVALRTGAPLLPVHAIRLADHTFKVEIDLPLQLVRSEDWEADVSASMEQLAHILERWIAQHPDQWQLSVPVWAAEPHRA